MSEEKQEWKNAEDAGFEFMRERIKERPVNKKKLLRRTVFTASMAVLFGLIACVTVLVLEPVISNWLYPEEEAEPIVFPPETEEMLPEDMAQDDKELYEENNEAQAQPQPLPPQKNLDELSVFRGSYRRMQELSREVSRSLVTVTGVTSDMDWFDNMYESRGQTSGLIIGNNGKEYLVLANAGPLEEAESIRITFSDNAQAAAEEKAKDPVTGLTVLSVALTELEPDTLEKTAVANLGSSNYAALTGSPVMALGSPNGSSGSVIYGMVTSQGNLIDTVDSRYKLITTDIYGSSYSTGVLVNLNGEIVGIINQNYNDSEMKHIISAIGISELKQTMERLSNGKRQAYFGVHGMNVTQEANEELQVPFGAYVTEIEMDSPAMLAGIQSGDVITEIGGREITSYEECVQTLSELVPGADVSVTVMRQNQNEYKAMKLELTLGELE